MIRRIFNLDAGLKLSSNEKKLSLNENSSLETKKTFFEVKKTFSEGLVKKTFT